MRSAWLLAPIVLLAGCMDGSNDTSTSPTTSVPTRQVPASFALANDASGCVEAVGVLLVDPAVAQASLPPNWTAADAQGLLGFPERTGRGVVWFNGYTCANATMGRPALSASEFGILVEPPTLSNASHPAATFNIYQLVQLTDSARQLEALQSVDAPVRAANVTVSRTPLPGGFEQGTVRAGNASSPFHSFTYSALLPDTFNGTADFWHATPDGMASFHFAIGTTPVLKGSITECSFDDPLARNATGISRCDGTSAFVVLIPQQQWTSEFRWMPGVRALAPAQR